MSTFGDLIKAIEKNDVSLIQSAITHGADIKLPFIDDCTPLGYAASLGHLEAVSMLISSGADVNQEISEDAGYSALICAVSSGKLDVVKVLVEAGADVDAESSQGSSAIVEAAYGGRREIYEYLAEHIQDTDWLSIGEGILQDNEHESSAE
jgi:ankyrin repeat protein